MTVKGDAMLRRLTKFALREAKAKAYANVRAASPTLARAMRQIVDGVGLGRLHIPHYWAVYVNDGRRAPFGPKRGTYLIWYRNPKKDPRLRPFGGHTPQRLSQWRRLTRAEFREARKMNKLHIAKGGSRSTMPVIFTKQVRRPTAGKRFFENDPGKMKGIPERMHKTVQGEMTKLVVAEALGGKLKDTQTIRMKI